MNIKKKKEAELSRQTYKTPLLTNNFKKLFNYIVPYLINNYKYLLECR